MRRLLAVLLAVAILPGCAPTESASVRFGPVSLEINRAGEVVVQAGRAFLTPLGDLPTDVSIDRIKGADDRHWYLGIRRTVDGERRDLVYRLESQDELQVISNGEFTEEDAPRTVLIEVPPSSGAWVDIVRVGEDGEIDAENIRVATPAALRGTWTGRLNGSRAVYTIYAAEGSHPTGEFRYADWQCRGVFILESISARRKNSVTVRPVLLTFHKGDGCGQFDQQSLIELTMAEKGVLEVETSRSRGDHTVSTRLRKDR